MRVLMIATNRERAPFAVAPVGAAHLVSVLEAAGHTVAFLDLGVVVSVQRRLKQILRRFRPELICLSIRNLDNCLYPDAKVYYPETRRLMRLIRTHSKKPILIGGSAVTVLPEELAAYLDTDYAIVGEGEKSLPMFIAAHETGGDLYTVPGLMIRKGSGWSCTPPDFSVNLDDMPVYAYGRINYPKYFRRGGFIGLQTKRGCTFRCVYCNYRTLEGARVRRRSPGMCVDDMARIVAETGLRDFFFTDSVFNWPRDHAAAICEEIIRRGLNVRWMAYCNPAGFDRPLAQLFKASGCAGVELGLDAATDVMLANMGKGFSADDIERAYAALTAAGLPFAVFLLFGGPGDSYRNMVATRKRLNQFGRANAVFASIGIRIYRDAPIYHTAVAEGRLSASDPLLEPVYYLSSEFEADIIGKLDRLARREATWSTPTDWNSFVVGAVQRLLGRMRVIPNWRDIAAYGAHMRRPR